jgi:uncharacterized membrane protein YedE/YeeE
VDDRGLVVIARLVAVPFGIAFGFLLAWAHLTDPQVIRAMLLLDEPYVFFLMGSAMMVAAVGAHLLRAVGARSMVGGAAVTWSRTRPTRDHIVGSVVFGLGWSLACTCPGPLAAQLGVGQLAGLFTGAGLILGVILRGSRSHLNHRSGVAVGS